MATLLTTMIGLMGGGGSAATATATAAAATTTSALSIGSVVTTVVGGLSALFAGASQKRALDQQAVDEETRAVQETINGKQDALEAMRRMNKDMAAIAVAGYASGIGSEGSVAAAQAEAQKIGEQNMAMARENSRFSSAARRGQARELRAEGKAALAGGIIKGIGGAVNLFDRRDERG
jgi:hypothetical protein